MSNIITASDLNTFTGKTLDNAKATQVAAAVNAWIEQHTHRFWGGTTSVTERYDYKGILWLRHQDVQSVTSIKLGYPGQTQSTLDPNSYYSDTYGRVSLFWAQPRAISNRNNDYMEVTYTYGVTNVPDDLKTAALAIAGALYNHVAAGLQTVVAESVGSYRVETAAAIRGSGNQGPNVANNSAELYFQIVDSYVMRRQ